MEGINNWVLWNRLLFLQLAKNIGNAGFNEIMECCLPSEDPVKPNPGSDMWVSG